MRLASKGSSAALSAALKPALGTASGSPLMNIVTSDARRRPRAPVLARRRDSRRATYAAAAIAATNKHS